MTKTERNRTSRRISLLTLGISGVLHVAVLQLVTLPAPELSAPAERLTLLPPLVEPVMLELEAVTPSVTAAAQAQVADAGGAGLPGAAAVAPSRPVPQAPTPDAAVASRPVAGEQVALAALDSLTNAELTAQPAAEPAPLVVATLSDGESADDGQAARPAAPAHVPGSAARAKGGNVSAGSGASGGFGGITIGVGGGGRKKHPPRGMPGRGRW